MANLKLLHISIVLSLSYIAYTSCNELPIKLPVDKSDNSEGFQSNRPPISDNSTLAQALVLARQFLARDENIITSANVELFKRSENSDDVNVSTEKPKMYSWWNKKPTSSSSQSPDVVTTEENESLNDASQTDEPLQESTTSINEQMSTSVKPSPTTEWVIAFLPPTTMTNNPPTQQDPYPSHGTMITTSVTPSTSMAAAPTNTPISFTTDPEVMSSTTAKPTRKPRPSKRPPKGKLSTSTSNLIHPTTSTSPPTIETEQLTITEETPNSLKDPFGIKRKLASIARSVGKAVLNQTRSIASNTAERVVPVARDAARHAGIFALTAAGQLGTLTKNTAEDAYENLAKRLNATELLEMSRNQTNQNSNKAQDSQTSDQMNVGNDQLNDDEACSGVQKGSDFTVIMGTMCLLLMKYVVT